MHHRRRERLGRNLGARVFRPFFRREALALHVLEGLGHGVPLVARRRASHTRESRGDGVLVVQAPRRGFRGFELGVGFVLLEKSSSRIVLGALHRDASLLLVLLRLFHLETAPRVLLRVFRALDAPTHAFLERDEAERRRALRKRRVRLVREAPQFGERDVTRQNLHGGFLLLERRVRSAERRAKRVIRVQVPLPRHCRVVRFRNVQKRR
mmetsp:Transcript_13250/g.56440  ORF Transcript_13250/g.56440 Transcript_13250/m.56440 type:complete len:210 (+) Transcript_13250:419-1048(+)